MSSEMVPAPLRRNDTLESQRFGSITLDAAALQSRLDRSRHGLGSHSNNDQKPRPAVSEALTKASELYEVGKKFLTAYAHIALRRKARTRSIFEIVASPPFKPSETAMKDAEGHQIDPDDASLAQRLDWLYETLGGSDDRFIACIFTAENAKSNAGFMYDILKPLPAQIRRRIEAPRRALIYLLSQTPGWHLSDHVVKHIAQARMPENISIDLELPSRSPDPVSANQEPGSILWTICWQRWRPEAFGYKSDVDAYIWQLFRHPPPFSYVEIFVFKQGAPHNLRALLLFRTRDDIESFRREYRLMCSPRVGVTSPAAGLTQVICAALRVALSEVIVFLKEMSRELFNMKFRNRAHPSKEKVQHLIFLNDCLKRAELDTVNNLALLDDCTKTLPALTALDPNAAEADTLKRNLDVMKFDLQYIQTHLIPMRQDLENLLSEAEMQNSLQSRNTTMLTLLAAIYVPLAFVTSFLGMNVTDGTVQANPNQNSSFLATNSTLATLSLANSSLGNLTKTIIDETSPNPRLWDLRWFFYLSVPLLCVTIILPLITGPILRGLFQSLSKLWKFWRLSFVLSGFVYLICYYSLVFTESVAQSLASWLLTGICDGPLAIFTLYQGYRAFYLKESKTRWTFCWVFAVTLVCMVLDFGPNIPGPLLLYGAFGWFFILLVRLVQYSRSRQPKGPARADSESQARIFIS